MNRKEHKLDKLLESVRNAPPLISIDACKDFLASPDASPHSARTHRKGKQTLLIIITGGVMALITAIILFIISFGDAPAPMTERHRDTKSSSPTHLVESQQDAPTTNHMEKGNTNRDMQTLHRTLPTGSRRLSTPNTTLQTRPVRDSLELQRMNDMFAAWTKERIEGCRVFDLDTTTLHKYGLSFAKDGTIMQSYANATIGMKEDHSTGSTIISIRGLRPRTPKDSARLEELKSNLKTNNVPKFEAPPVSQVTNFCSPVLITNSKGRTLLQANPVVNERGDGRVGSGKYSGQELVAIRIRTENETLPSDSSDYFYLYWYEPTPKFLESMPTDVRRAIEGVSSSPIAEEQRKEVAETKVLASSSVHPNPATQGFATVEYTLREKRRVAISVYDITGERLKNVAVTENRDSGVWQDNVSLEGIPNGYYLLAVTTDQGEQSIRPFILKR